jgi:hypothetical protein
MGIYGYHLFILDTVFVPYPKHIPAARRTNWPAARSTNPQQCLSGASAPCAVLQGGCWAWRNQGLSLSSNNLS